jgi:hypothetical protein
MPVLFANDSEAQSSGTTVTTANSGDANSLAFDEVVIGANMTETFDNANPAHGANAIKVALTSTATAVTYVGATGAVLGAAQVTMNGAFYFTIHTAVASSVRWVAFLKDSTLIGYLGLVNGLQGVQWRTAADAATGTISGTLTADTLYRCEFSIIANGAGLARVFTGDTATQVGSDATTAANYTGTDINHVRWGCNTANFSSTSGQYLAMDDFMLTTDALPIGAGPYALTPVAGPPLVRFNPIPFQAQGRNL